MRRPLATAATAALAVLGAAGLLLPLTSCRSQAGSTPTVADVDFTPKATITVDDQGQLVATGSSQISDPHELPIGSVVVITNDSGRDQQVTGTLDDKPSIDTGMVHAGQQVTVVLATAGSLKVWPNADQEGDPLTITVTPRPH